MDLDHEASHLIAKFANLDLECSYIEHTLCKDSKDYEKQKEEFETLKKKREVMKDDLQRRGILSQKLREDIADRQQKGLQRQLATISV